MQSLFVRKTVQFKMVEEPHEKNFGKEKKYPATQLFLICEKIPKTALKGI